MSRMRGDIGVGAAVADARARPSADARQCRRLTLRRLTGSSLKYCPAKPPPPPRPRQRSARQPTAATQHVAGVTQRVGQHCAASNNRSVPLLRPRLNPALLADFLPPFSLTKVRTPLRSSFWRLRPEWVAPVVLAALVMSSSTCLDALVAGVVAAGVACQGGGLPAALLGAGENSARRRVFNKVIKRALNDDGRFRDR